MSLVVDILTYNIINEKIAPILLDSKKAYITHRPPNPQSCGQIGTLFYNIEKAGLSIFDSLSLLKIKIIIAR